MAFHLNFSRLRRLLALAGLCLILVPWLSPVQAISPLASAENPETINLLLIGQDRLEGESRARADSIILCTFRRNSGQLVLTSFLRDLYVPIPGCGSNRINAAYTFGGIPLMRQTLKENFDLEVDGCIEVDFSQFVQIIDVLGGVELELRPDEAALISEETGTQLTEGLQKLNGDQALSYSRIRRLDADGDFSRTQRQRRVLGKLLETYKDAHFVTIVRVLNQLRPMITTDLGAEEILHYALVIFPMLSGANTVTQQIPADGTYRDEVVEGMCVLVADIDLAKKLLNSTTNPR